MWVNIENGFRAIFFLLLLMVHIGSRYGGIVTDSLFFSSILKKMQQIVAI